MCRTWELHYHTSYIKSSVTLGLREENKIVSITLQILGYKDHILFSIQVYENKKTYNSILRSFLLSYNIWKFYSNYFKNWDCRSLGYKRKSLPTSWRKLLDLIFVLFCFEVQHFNSYLNTFVSYSVFLYCREQSFQHKAKYWAFLELWH